MYKGSRANIPNGVPVAANPFPKTPDKGPVAALNGLTLFLGIFTPSASKRSPPKGLFLLPAQLLCLYNSAPPGIIPPAVTAPQAVNVASPRALLGPSLELIPGPSKIPINTCCRWFSLDK